MAASLEYTQYRYGSENELQRLGVWRFPGDDLGELSSTTRPDKYWIVYIHGGAWRDPRIDHSSIIPTIDVLLGGGTTWPPFHRISGFASLDYRLSSHPDFPQAEDGHSVPAFSLRAARHPDHVLDVRAGLALLRRVLSSESGEDPRILLYGHSCGATLALQVLMGRDALRSAGGDKADPTVQNEDGKDEVPLPVAVVGFEGIYDLPGLNGRFSDAYRGFMSAAFGTDESVWAAASPALYQWRDRFGRRRRGETMRSETNSDDGPVKRESREECPLIVLAYSPEDSLIDALEIDNMEKAVREGGLDVLAYRDLSGEHDVVWKNGWGIARVLLGAIEGLERLGKKREERHS
ncbi:hypothetical protein VTK73DRAFT_7072 [Phialemonium thermophilum]|uniref:Kynurenine formamidase n=1 Tax=Phialemonium thermophilum TaxID=223376 RepID=A0ABR3WGJ1_9PEZI